METKLRKWQWERNCSHAKGISGIGHHQPTNGQHEFEPIKIIYISWIHIIFYFVVDTEVNAHQNYYLMQSAMPRFFFCLHNRIGRQADDLGRARWQFLHAVQSHQPKMWLRCVRFHPFNRCCDNDGAANDIESNKISVTMQILFLIFRRRHFYGDVKFWPYTYLRHAFKETRSDSRDRERERIDDRRGFVIRNNYFAESHP